MCRLKNTVGQLKKRIEEPQMESKDRVQETGRVENLGWYHNDSWRIQGHYLSEW